MENLHYYGLQQELFTQGSNFYPRTTDFHLAQPFDEAYHRPSIFRSAVPIKGLSAVFAPIWALKWFVTLYSGTRFPCNKTKLNFVLDSILKISSTWYQAGPRCHTPCDYPAPGVQHQGTWHLCRHCFDTCSSCLQASLWLQKQ